MTLTGPAEVETPQERAVRRVEELKRAVGGVLDVLAAIYRDEDWRYLHDDTGTPFTGFNQFVQYTLGGSASNARRYRQGVETLVAPLRELTASGTRIPVTPNDIVQLGQSGARRVVAAAPAVLSGISDSGAQTAALRGLIDEVITERHSPTGAGAARPDAESLLPTVPATLPATPVRDAAVAGDYSGSAAADGPGVDAPAVMSACDSPDEHATKERGRRETGQAQSELATHVGAGAPINGTELQAALATVLSVDPVAAVDAVDAAHTAQLASDCLAAAQRLARLGQLLKALH
ncbi:hypothetical protein PFJ02_23710 [Mycobacterium xenopi]|nr:MULTISPECIES: hypothetical protein [Mycobacterium]MDA3664975.1 hypothetical protein [Mycobacterium xenopi]